MYVTRKTDYAVRCVLFLSQAPGRITRAGEISEAMLVPKTLLAKILQRLAKRGIVTSVRGAAGGFRLAKPPSEISLFEVIEAIQGTFALNACAVDRAVCSLSGGCAVHPVWMELRRNVEKRLKDENFARLTRKKSKDRN